VLITQGDKPRVQAWGGALRMFRASPFIGGGYGMFMFQHERYGEPLIDAPHNEILRLFAEDGALVGMIGLAFGVTSLAVLSRGRTWLAGGLFTSFVSWCVMINFNNPFSYMQVTVPVFIALGSGLGLAWAAARATAVVGEGDPATIAASGAPARDSSSAPPTVVAPA
jgi:O-antigen ligase